MNVEKLARKVCNFFSYFIVATELINMYNDPPCYLGETYYVTLVGQGYRVLVVEQTETPEQLELRRKEKGSKDKV